MTPTDTQFENLKKRVKDLEGQSPTPATRGSWTKALREWWAIILFVLAASAYVGHLILDQQIRAADVPLQSQLGKISGQVNKIEGELSEIQGSLGAISLRQLSDKPTDPKSAREAKKFLAEAKSKGTKLPPEAVKAAADKFIAASEKQPLAWEAAMQFADYRSYLNKFAPNIGPGPAAKPKRLVTRYPLNFSSKYHEPKFQVVGVVPKDQAARLGPLGSPLYSSNEQYGNQWILVTGGALLLGGYGFKNVIFTDTHIIFQGGPVELQNVYFIDCTFEVTRNASGKKLASAIVASTKIDAAIS